MTTISATIVLDSVNEQGNRITTIRARYPKWIHAEGRTHRQLRMGEDEFPWIDMRTPSPMQDPNLSRNAASSRAIPVKKMIEAIRQDPAVPLFWGANQKGMQAGEEINETVWLLKGRETPYTNEQAWLYGMEQMIELAEAFDRAGYHKQIVNRLLEPFMHIDTLFTATEWTNFFTLRIHNAAEPHICLLATRIDQAMSKSTPKLLRPGDWHMPYYGHVYHPCSDELLTEIRKLSVARCAHLSYEAVGTGERIMPEQAERIYTQLLGSQPIHASPAEHQATPDKFTGTPWPIWQRPHEHGNLKGWRQFRKMLPGECQ